MQITLTKRTGKALENFFVSGADNCYRYDKDSKRRK